MECYNQIILQDGDDIKIFQSIVLGEDFTIVKPLSQGDFFGVSYVALSNEYIKEHEISQEEMQRILDERRKKIEVYEIGQPVFIANRSHEYAWDTNVKDSQYSTFDCFRFVGYDTLSYRILVANKYGIKSYSLDKVGDILSLDDYKSYVRGQKNHLQELIWKYDKICKILKDMDKTYFSYFPERIENLIKEKNLISRWLPKDEHSENEYSRQVRCIDKGIRRLSKRLREFTEKFPQYDIVTLSHIYYSRSHSHQQESVIKMLDDNLNSNLVECDELMKKDLYELTKSSIESFWTTI